MGIFGSLVNFLLIKDGGCLNCKHYIRERIHTCKETNTYCSELINYTQCRQQRDIVIEDYKKHLCKTEYGRCDHRDQEDSLVKDTVKKWNDCDLIEK